MDISVGKRVFILENDADCRSRIISLLKSEGFEIAGAYGLQQGENILHGTPVDLIMMAVNWLDLQLMERLELLREQHFHHRTPVILMMHFSNVREFSPDIQSMQCELLLKPFLKKELLSCITGVIPDFQPSGLQVK